jgi:hypothetical protein
VFSAKLVKGFVVKAFVLLLCAGELAKLSAYVAELVTNIE